MYMGEIGHNSDEWQAQFVRVMKAANIGFTFWPYKKIDGSCMMGVKRPAEWDSVIVKFSETSRNSFKEWREARPDQRKTLSILREYLENCKFGNCVPQKSYIESMQMK